MTQDGYDWPNNVQDERWPAAPYFREQLGGDFCNDFVAAAMVDMAAINDQIMQGFAGAYRLRLPPWQESMASVRRLHEINKAALAPHEDVPHHSV